jgi:hypothetical protein
MFLRLGGFDVAFQRPSIEDIEFGYRLTAVGGLIRQAVDLQGTHLKVWTFKSLIIAELRDRAIPWAFLLLTRGYASDELNVAVTERIRALVACLCVTSLAGTVIGLIPWWFTFFLLVTAFVANLELFAVFHRKNGLFFAVRGILFHQFYYLYSTTAYCWCWLVTKSKWVVLRGCRGTQAVPG